MAWGRPEFDYEVPIRFWYCNIKAPRWVAWTEQNAGRRFYSCIVSYEVSVCECGL